VSCAIRIGFVFLSPFLKDVIDTGRVQGVDWPRYRIKMVMAGVVRYFEAEERALIFSGDNGVPLVRYAILDTGGIFSYEELLAQLRPHGFDIEQALGSAARGVRALPFVYVFGRSDFTVSFFGANIYPENIAIGLERPEIKEWVTGKFVLEVREDADRNKILAVVIELAPNEVASDERTRLAAQAIRSELLRINSEFGAYVPADSQLPFVVVLPTADPQWFPAGVKHRYTRR
jgi:phenylacetate-CoA ligase